MRHITGKQVFEMLSSMTDEQREHCVFPGFFDEEEYDILLSETAGNVSMEDEEADRLLETDKGKMAKWTQEAIGEFYELWGEYVQSVRDSVASKAVAEATK